MPDRFAMLFFTTSMPTPRPESEVTCRAVEKPGTKMRFITSRRDSSRTACAVASPRATATSRTRSSSIPAPSSSTTIWTWLPLCSADSRTRPDARLARARARLGRLDRVVDRVADEVHERVGEVLDDELVELDVAAGHLEVDLLPHLAGDLPDHPRELVEDLLERDHPDLEDALLQLREPPLEGAVRVEQLGGERGVPALRLDPLGDRLQRRLHEHELADDLHEPVELADVDAHRLRDRAQRRRFVRGRLRRGREARGRGPLRARRPRRAGERRPTAAGSPRAAGPPARGRRAGAATASTTAAGPASRCTTLARLPRREEELERDRGGIAERPTDGSVETTSPSPLQAAGERRQLPVERGEVEAHPHAEEADAPSARWRGAGAPRTR